METGMEFLKIVSPFYFVISLKLMADGVLRGAGAMKSFMIATFSDLLLRVILAFILAGPFGTLGIWLSWPIGWMVAMVLSLSFYKKRCLEEQCAYGQRRGYGGGSGAGDRRSAYVHGRGKRLKYCNRM